MKNCHWYALRQRVSERSKQNIIFTEDFQLPIEPMSFVYFISVSYYWNDGALTFIWLRECMSHTATPNCENLSDNTICNVSYVCSYDNSIWMWNKALAEIVEFDGGITRCFPQMKLILWRRRRLFDEDSVDSILSDKTLIPTSLGLFYTYTCISLRYQVFCFSNTKPVWHKLSQFPWRGINFKIWHNIKWQFAA